MQNPVFKLEKVVRSKSEEEMQDFEGPLDLILYLLGKNKMEIQDISISLICDQYMAWLARRQEMDLEVASEFVTMPPNWCTSRPGCFSPLKMRRPRARWMP